MQPTRGAIAKQPNLRIAMLDQHRDFGAAANVWDAAALEYREVIALEQALARQGERLAELGERVTEDDLERYGRDMERFAHLGGYEFHARVDKVLQGLGFDAEESKTRALAGLSGGERGRVGLAAQLAAPADLVLLDEPTNHLDLETIEWLKEYLGEFGETVLVISHDRAFLDDTVDHILHVSNNTAVEYRGGYTQFVTLRAEREMALARAVAKQRKVIAKEEDYIRRNIAGRMSNQAKGRRAKLARLPRLSPPPGEGEAMSLTLEIDERGGDQVLVADKLDVKVGERMLVRDFSAVARRSDVVALVGPNGAGKSTLLATLLGDREPARGEARLGGSVSAAWFRQDLAQVPTDKTIYDCIADLRPNGPVARSRTTSAPSASPATRCCATPRCSRAASGLAWRSRSSRSRAPTCSSSTSRPTISTSSRSRRLEDALDEYEGTVILVSHDRAFLRELVDPRVGVRRHAPRGLRWPLRRVGAACRRTRRAPQCGPGGGGGGGAQGGEGGSRTGAGAERRLAPPHG